MFNCSTPRCQNRYSGGFGVVTFSGNLTVLDPWKGWQGIPVCNLSSHSKIYHIVIVANYNTYPIDDIDCTGTIPAATPALKNLEFNSPNSPPDTDTCWHNTSPSLIGIGSISSTFDEDPFHHVQLHPTTGPRPNYVDVVVTATPPPHRLPITIPKIKIT